MPIEAQELVEQVERAESDTSRHVRDAADKIQKFLKGHRGTMFLLAELEEAIGLDRESLELGIRALRKLAKLSQPGTGKVYFGYY